MPRLLFTIEDRFQIRGRGLIVVPGLAAQGDERFRIGDPLLLKRPDGSSLLWTIGGLEMMITNPVVPPEQRRVPVLLIGQNKDDVPAGTEVWSVDPAASS